MTNEQVENVAIEKILLSIEQYPQLPYDVFLNPSFIHNNYKWHKPWFDAKEMCAPCDEDDVTNYFFYGIQKPAPKAWNSHLSWKKANNAYFNINAILSNMLALTKDKMAIFSPRLKGPGIEAAKNQLRQLCINNPRALELLTSLNQDPKYMPGYTAYIQRKNTESAKRVAAKSNNLPKMPLTVEDETKLLDHLKKSCTDITPTALSPELQTDLQDLVNRGMLNPILLTIKPNQLEGMPPIFPAESIIMQLLMANIQTHMKHSTYAGLIVAFKYIEFIEKLNSPRKVSKKHAIKHIINCEALKHLGMSINPANIIFLRKEPMEDIKRFVPTILPPPTLIVS